jgi:hypothetical protein
MECTLEQGDEISLNGFLESTDGGGLESEIGLEVLGNFPDETLEGEFADQELSRFLVTTDLTEGDCTGAITMGLLDTSGCGGGFSGSLGGELFARGFATSRLTGSLLCAGHWMCVVGGCCTSKTDAVGYYVCGGDDLENVAGPGVYTLVGAGADQQNKQQIIRAVRLGRKIAMFQPSRIRTSVRSVRVCCPLQSQQIILNIWWWSNANQINQLELQPPKQLDLIAHNAPILV